MRIIIGSDHGGYELKEFLKQKLTEAGYAVTDIGTNTKDSVDYPDFALQVAEGVASGTYDRGIMIDAIGNASAITCNKVPGIRAAVAINEFSVKSSREHNNSNVLTLGGLFYAPSYAWQLVDLWLKTEYQGGRHQRRLDKISAVEQKYAGSGTMELNENLIRTIIISVLKEMGYLKDESNVSLRYDVSSAPKLEPKAYLSEIKTAGISVAAPKATDKKVIVEADVIQAARAGQKKIIVGFDTIITQLAIDAAKDYGIKIERRG